MTRSDDECCLVVTTLILLILVYLSCLVLFTRPMYLCLTPLSSLLLTSLFNYLLRLTGLPDSLLALVELT